MTLSIESIVLQIETETGRQTTLNEMKENSIRCALWMQMQGIGIGDVVVVCTHIHADAYIPVISTLLVGAIYNPWHYEISLSKLIFFNTIPSLVY